MAIQGKQIHFRVQEGLFLRMDRVAAKNKLRVSQLLRHVLEKSLDLMEIGEGLPSLPSSQKAGRQELQGKTYTFQNVTYHTGGEVWPVDASEH